MQFFPGFLSSSQEVQHGYLKLTNFQKRCGAHLTQMSGEVTFITTFFFYLSEKKKRMKFSCSWVLQALQQQLSFQEIRVFECRVFYNLTLQIEWYYVQWSQSVYNSFHRHTHCFHYKLLRRKRHQKHSLTEGNCSSLCLIRQSRCRCEQ